MIGIRGAPARMRIRRDMSDWRGTMDGVMRPVVRSRGGQELTDEARFEPGADSFEWSDGTPTTSDRGAHTYLSLPDLSRQVGRPEAELERLLETGAIDGVWTGTEWLATPATVSQNEEAGWARRRGVDAAPFQARPRYSAAGDCLFFYFHEDESWADRVDEILTVYRSFETKRVVGFKLKNVSLLKERLGAFLVEFETREVQIYLLFKRMLRWKLRDIASPDTTVELVRKYAEAMEAAGPTRARLPVLA